MKSPPRVASTKCKQRIGQLPGKSTLACRFPCFFLGLCRPRRVVFGGVLPAPAPKDIRKFAHVTKAPCWNIRDCIHCSRSCFSQGGTTPADAKFFGAFKKEACSPRALAPSYHLRGDPGPMFPLAFNDGDLRLDLHCRPVGRPLGLTLSPHALPRRLGCCSFVLWVLPTRR